MATVTADLSTRSTPGWFDEAKLGIFVHWNPAAIPAYAPPGSIADLLAADPSGVKAYRRMPYAESYWNSMTIPGSPARRHHDDHYPDLGYEDFVRQFRNEVIPAWDPEPWADLCARAGARYVVLTTKMEDGFLLWPSAHRNPHRQGWQAERDVVGELAAAVRRRGLRFGAYYCGGLDLTFQGLPITGVESLLAAMPEDEGYAAYADAHWRELIDRYEPSVLWNDVGYPAAADLARLVRTYVDRVPDGVVNNRFLTPTELARIATESPIEGASPDLGPSKIYSDFLTPEYTTGGAPEHKWETCRGLGGSFGYNREERYIGSDELIHTFVDVVSRGGNLLINIGPTGSGAVPFEQADRLLTLGWWLESNGEAIYGTSPWDRSSGMTGEGMRVCYTSTADAVYATVLGTPPRSDVDIDVRLADGAHVSLLGHDRPLPWEATPAGVRVYLPSRLDERPAVSLRLHPRTAVTPYDET